MAPEPGPVADKGEQEKAGAGRAFPVFVGHRRRLLPDDPLFEAGNLEREQLTRQVAVAAARDERQQLSREAGLAAQASLPVGPLAAFECAQCRASLPTARLLDIHVAELHDSFFAAQAARRMPVYVCLVEGCSRKFCTVEERKQHLQDHHQFPRHFHFDRLHLRRRKAQIRPLPQLQKGHGRQAMGQDAGGGGAGPPATPQQQQQPGQGAGDAMQQDAGPGPGSPRTAVLQGMSRLRLAAESSAVPETIHFGRGRGRGLPGRAGRAAGRGQKGKHGQAGAAPAAAPGGSQ